MTKTLAMGLIETVLCFFLIAPSGSGQDLGAITGRVQDAKGVAVPGATVRVVDSGGTSVETLTEVDGSFTIEELRMLPYTLTVEMEGFQSFTRVGLKPRAEASRPLVIVLESSRAAPEPTTPGENRPALRAPARARLPAEQTPAFPEISLAEIPGMEQFQSNPLAPGLPAGESLQSRDNSDLLVITGNTPAGIFAGDWNDPDFRERMMAQARQMGFRIDRVGRGGEGGFGGGERQGGGGPAGQGLPAFGAGGRGMRFQQSRLNGSIEATYGNSFFDARPYSLTGDEIAQPVKIQNVFGASLGGPLPWGSRSSEQGAPRRGRFGGRQNGMWFFSYSGNRDRNPCDVLTTVPTELERAGNFSRTTLGSGPPAGQPAVIYDPFTPNPAPFPEATIPGSQLDPIALALLEYIPLPNLPGSVQNYTMQRGLVSTNDNISARVNTPLTSKSNVFVNYGLRSGGSVQSQTYPGLDTDRTSRSQNVAVGGVYRPQTRVVLNYRISYNRVRTQSANGFAFNDDVAGGLGIEGVSQDPLNWGIPNLRFTNYGDLGLGNAALSRFQTFTVGGGLNKIGNRHSLRVGGDISWNQRNVLGDSDARGTFTFTGFASSAFDSEGRPVAGSGYDFADFLLGLPYSSSRQFGSSNNYLRAKSLNLFMEDNWRLRSNLTVNFGVRYEYIQPFYEKYDRIVNLDVAEDFTAVAQALPNQDGPYSGRFPRSLVYSDKNNFGPRIGIAWKPRVSAPWVIRAGYGIFYNPSVYPFIYGNLAGQPPFAVGQDVLTTPSNPLTLQCGFPEDPDVTIRNTYAIDPHYRIGYVQQWNLNIQTQFLRGYILEVGYNGSRGTRLDILRAPNRAPSGLPPGQTEDNRVIDDAGSFLYQDSNANSILHALQVGFHRRFSRGFRMQNSYTLSKSIDNASRIGGGGLLVVQDDTNIGAERSLSSFDQRHRLESQFNVDLPVGERRKFFYSAPIPLLKLISGWSVNGTYQLLSGTPLTPRILGNISNNSGTGSNYSERPDGTGEAVALPLSARTTAAFFNTGAFAIPQPGRFGDAGRNTIPGPGTNLLNLSLRKSFPLDDDNRRLEFRWQVSNVLNHPNYGGVATTVNALNFGRVTSVRAMRKMEFHIRVNF